MEHAIYFTEKEKQVLEKRLSSTGQPDHVTKNWFHSSPFLSLKE